jgi:hypothetical protein
MITLAAALFIASNPGVHLNAERAQATRVHLLVASPTRAIVVTRVQRPGQYLKDMLAVETLCRNECDLDVDVDPRLDYVLEVVSDTPGEDVYRYRYDVNMTAYGDSLVLKVDPPSQARFTASKVMVPVGIVASIASTVVAIVGAGLAADRSSYAPGYGPTFFGADPAFLAAGGAGGIVLGVATCIIGVVLRRTALFDVTAFPGTTPPSDSPVPPLQGDPQGPVQM